MKRHFILILARLLLAIVVFYALPFSHLTWGERYPGDGQQAFGFVVMFAVIGMAAAALYFGLGSLFQFFLRRRAVCYSLLADLGLFAFFAGVLVWGGVTARYRDRQPNKAAPGNVGTASQLRIGHLWPTLPKWPAKPV